MVGRWRSGLLGNLKMPYSVASTILSPSRSSFNDQNHYPPMLGWECVYFVHGSD